MRSTPQAASPDFSKLVGIPYAQLDCFKLAQKFYADVLGLELKHYYEDVPATRSEMQNLVYTHRGEFEQVSEPAFGDLVLIKIEGLESHIAVYVGNGMILHTLRTTGCSVVERMHRWKTVISGYYRLRESHD